MFARGVCWRVDDFCGVGFQLAMRAVNTWQDAYALSNFDNALR